MASEGKELVSVSSISSGKTSCLMALKYPTDVYLFACVCIDYLQAKPKDPAVLKYCLEKLNGNFIASAEHEKSLKIMMQLEQLIGKEIKWVRGKSFDELLWESPKKAMPSHLHRWCTTDMKIMPIFEYCWFNYGKVKMNIGFRMDEVERAYIFKKGEPPIRKVFDTIKYPISCNNFGAKNQNWDNEIAWREKNYPLIDDRIFHYNVVNFWATEHPEFKFPHDSNCQNCHHKPKEQIKKNHQESPEILEWAAEQEHMKKAAGAAIYTWHDDKVMYSDTFNMKSKKMQLQLDFTMCNSGYCTD